MKLLCLNLELDRHLDDQRRLFDREAPDIACLQEMHEIEFDALRAEFGHGTFAPMCRTRRLDGEFTRQGVCILSRHPIEVSPYVTYRDAGGPIVDFEIFVTPQSLLKRILVLASIKTGTEAGLTFATTHFTWSPDGQPNDEQRRDVARLLDSVAGREPLVLCGDFNAPRGGEIFSAIAARYTDRIPVQQTTSIDGSRHRAGPLDLLVDGLFASDDVEVGDVRLIDGVSDHLGIIADIAVK